MKHRARKRDIPDLQAIYDAFEVVREVGRQAHEALQTMQYDLACIVRDLRTRQDLP